MSLETSAEESNPFGFSICIEAHEHGETPTNSRLAHASHYMDAIEATALFEVESKAALRELEQEAEDDPTANGSPNSSSDDDERGTLYLGPNGWSPNPYGRPKRGGPRRANHVKGHVPSPQLPVVPSPAGIVHLECASTSANLTEWGVKAHVERYLSLCAWIKKQAVRPKAPASVAHHGAVYSALRGVGYGKNHGHGHSHSHGNGAAQLQDSRSVHQQQPRRVLLHCGDGYTETAVLALSYLMYSRELSLPEAYLHLQLQCKRSFFVYARELPLLKKIEEKLVAERKVREKQASKDRERHAEHGAEQAGTARVKSRHGFGWSAGHGSAVVDDEREEKTQSNKRQVAHHRTHSSRRSFSSSSSTDEQSVWARGLAAATGLVTSSSSVSASASASSSSSSLASSAVGTPSAGGKNKGGATCTPTSQATPSRTHTPTPRAAGNGNGVSILPSTGPTPTPVTDHSWFHDKRFEGSFPSRILPFLYLGNLNHALNAKMLHALEITHVVSVGETALSPPRECDKLYAKSGLPGSSVAAANTLNSLWHEEREGRISVLDLKNVCDDGIDPLRSTMRQAVEYIEAARRSGGKVLVHCRVGVSRSSTIVLAYVMAHLDLSLVEAYLLVRSRRLNILIQPHLLFFWELRGWETYLIAQKSKRNAMLASVASAANGAGTDADEEMLDANNAGTETDTERERANHYNGAVSLASLSLRGSPTQPGAPAQVSPVASPFQLSEEVDANAGANANANANKDAQLYHFPSATATSPSPASPTHAALSPTFSSPFSSPLAGGSTGSNCGFASPVGEGDADGAGAERDLDVDLGSGSGSVYGFAPYASSAYAPSAFAGAEQGSAPHPNVDLTPFGTGSPAGLPYQATRMTWGFLCREITALNERYFV